MKIRRAMIITMVYVLIQIVVYLVHIRYFRVDVVFYSALSDVIISVVIASFILVRIHNFGVFNYFEKAQLVLIWLLVGYILAISVPTVIDRSLSFYLLEKIQQRGGGIEQEAFQDIFTQEFVLEHRLVDVRLTEQLESGTITIEDGCVKLTSRGNQLATFSRIFRRHLLPKKRQLMGEFSDDLTDPFRNSPKASDYACE